MTELSYLNQVHISVVNTHSLHSLRDTLGPGGSRAGQISANLGERPVAVERERERELD